MNRRWLPMSLRLWLLFMVGYAYFFQADNPNISPRIGLSISIAQRHELTLGPFASPKIDEAFVDGAYFSDKAPGLSLLATPVAAAVLAAVPHREEGSLWFTPKGGFSLAYFAVVYLSTVIVVSGLSATALAGMYVWTIRQGASRSAALVATLALGLCSPFWGWSTVFVGHAPAGALLFVGFALLSVASESSGPDKRAVLLGFLAGLVLGAAFVVEFTSGPAVAIIGIGCLVAAMRGPDRLAVFRRAFVPSALGLLAAFIPLLIYNQLAFGSLFKLGYEGVSQSYPGMEVGFFGLSAPRPAIAVLLLFGKARGLLTFWPGFVLVPAALVAGFTTAGFRLLAIVAATVFIYYLCMNAGYYYWDGGYSTGPRHLIAALPLLAPLVAPLWDYRARVTRPLVTAVLAISFVATMAYVSIEMFAPAPSLAPDPWRDFFLPALLDGTMRRSLLAHFVPVNGYVGLVPLLILVAAIGWWIWKELGRGRAAGMATGHGPG